MSIKNKIKIVFIIEIVQSTQLIPTHINTHIYIYAIYHGKTTLCNWFDISYSAIYILHHEPVIYFFYATITY